jgi:hypothetical protein
MVLAVLELTAVVYRSAPLGDRDDRALARRRELVVEGARLRWKR